MYSKKIALVIPWFGEDQTGGAEQQAFHLATQLSLRTPWQVEVLTTCSESFLSDWGKNKHPEGAKKQNKLCIRRFKVDPRKPKLFNKAVDHLLQQPNSELTPGMTPVSHAQEEMYWQHNINSQQLLDYLEQHHEEYHAVLMLPYLFGVVASSALAIAQKTILVPCLHDECYAYLDKTFSAFAKARYIAFNSEGERVLACRIFGDWIKQKSSVLGEGIELTWDAPAKQPSSSERFAWQGKKFILSLGRQCQEKNTHLAIKAFQDYTQRQQSSMHLILAGASDPEFVASRPKHPQITYLGFVEPAERISLLNQCSALVIASTNESFSRVMYEAWSQKKPVIVNQECLATACAVQSQKTAKGFIFSGTEELSQVYQKVDQLSKQELFELGEAGYHYAKQLANWEHVTKSYQDLFEEFNQLDLWESQKDHTKQALNKHTQLQLSSSKIYLSVFSQLEMQQLKHQLNLDPECFEVLDQNSQKEQLADVAVIWGEIPTSFEQEILQLSRSHIPVLGVNIPSGSWLLPLSGSLADPSLFPSYLHALSSDLDFYQSWSAEQRLEHGRWRCKQMAPYSRPL